ncbi:hypothetical protein BST81_14815 [Leptolyngbya sp. 'hensonii']|uniref:DUF3172 domain-containing protein n=1 Tax=Leptolyngbya sp. 'hensonii' TaxID=1922337 RepID=UPI00094F5DDA|nr:DUF3172 domain-containing protein [Leptolyngbya sp. 'hensonii']OLP17594.1 hypothetical protein BST81_14815 [Leptolyngbya sp. 'hensonii']
MKRKSKPSLFKSSLSYAMIAVLGAIFSLGVMVGISFSSVASSGPENIASREVIDAAAPDKELCLQYGSSAITMDARIYVTLNPFKIYVSQAKTQPGCVLRNSNWAILEQRKLVNSEQVQQCKQRMNTFGFTGDLSQSPQVNCVYENDGAQNLFLNQLQGVSPS